MLILRVVNSMADFCAPPMTVRRAITRFAVFLVGVFPFIWLGDYFHSPVAFGFVYGYIVGSLTVYGIARKLQP